MNSLLLFCSLIIFSNYVESYEEEDSKETFYNSDGYDYKYDDDPEKDDNSKAVVNTYTTPKAATYEVTEIVVDVPNTSTKLGPVIPNFTTPRPLNILNSNTKNITDSGLNFNNNNGFIDNDNKDESNIKPKRNYFTVFHVNAEYDDKPNTHTYSSNLDTIHHRPGFKEYLFGIKKGIINGFNKIFHRHGYGHDDHEFIKKDFGDSHKYREENSNEDEDIDHIFRHDVDKEFD